MDRKHSEWDGVGLLPKQMDVAVIPYKSSRGERGQGKLGGTCRGRVGRHERVEWERKGGADCSKLLRFHSSWSDLPTRHWKATEMSGTLDSLAEDNQMEAV